MNTYLYRSILLNILILLTVYVLMLNTACCEQSGVSQSIPTQ